MLKVKLQAELRNWEGEYHYPNGLLDRAADRIDELEQALFDVIEHSRPAFPKSPFKRALDAARILLGE